MSEPNVEIACENCVAACCKAPTYLQLSNKEYKRHSPPMDLEVVVKSKKFDQRVPYADAERGYVFVPSGMGLYELKSGCANLGDDNRCSIYTSRPQCCRDFIVGSPACRSARRKAGLDGGEEAPDEANPTQDLLQEFFPTRAGADPAPTQRAVAAVAAPTLDEIRAVLQRDAGWIAERLAACDPAAWSRRTRCAPWNVGALAAHLVTGQRLCHEVVTAALDGRDAVTPPDFEGDRAETVAAFARAKDAIADAIVRVTPNLLAREVIIDKVAAITLGDLLEAVVTELAMHGLDLAHALGETRHLSTDDVRVIAHALPNLLYDGVAPRAGSAYVLRSLTFEVPFRWRNDAWRSEPAPDPCWIEGEPEAVLLFALGREPFDESRLATNRVESARAFKRHLSGP